MGQRDRRGVVAVRLPQNERGDDGFWTRGGTPSLNGDASVAEHNVPENVDGCGVDDDDEHEDGESDDD